MNLNAYRNSGRMVFLLFLFTKTLFKNHWEKALNSLVITASILIGLGVSDSSGLRGKT